MFRKGIHLESFSSGQAKAVDRARAKVGCSVAVSAGNARPRAAKLRVAGQQCAAAGRGLSWITIIVYSTISFNAYLMHHIMDNYKGCIHSIKGFKN